MRNTLRSLPVLILLSAAAWAAIPTAPPDAKHINDVVYAKAGSRELHLDLVLPASITKPLPCVVWIHGGGWRKGTHKANRAAWLAGHGYVVASVEYRLTDEAVFPAQIQDCKAAIRFLRANSKDYGIDPDRIGVWGSSAGGHLVALLGTSGGVKELEGDYGSVGQSSRVQAVCDFFGPTDLTVIPGRLAERGTGAVALLLGGPISEKRNLARLASPIKHVSKDDPPFLIVHGEEDKLVPISQSESLQKALKAAGVDSTFVRVKNAAHGFAGRNIEPSVQKIDEAVLKFFDEHLKKGGA